MTGSPGADRLAVLTGGLLHDLHAKTAHGVLRYGSREVVAVVDDVHAGKVATEVMPYCDRPVPVVADVAAAHALGATVLLVGIAPAGGKLTPAWRAALLTAIGLGMDIEAGLHTTLADDPELAAAAAVQGVRVRDLRLSPDGLDVPLGPQHRVPARVVHSVGSDCAIGKMSVTLELDRAARARGLASVFVATGQTGIAIAGWGLAVDHVISDYIAGAAERLVRDGAARGDLLWVEGQGSLLHPAYSGVTLGLLHGSAPDALVLCHKAGSTAVDGYPATPIPPLPEVIAAYESAVSWVRPARVVAIGLNTAGLDEENARAQIEAVGGQTGLPTDDVVRFGPDRLLDAVLAATAPPATSNV
ncbi:MAG TPA: DUF1611 domain-containing protein [Kineosporiaceae bacterium]|nr:DUF1611 domain-containing protein [Kineosporiaceae bacterium]